MAEKAALSPEAAKSLRTKAYTHVVIMLILMLGIGFLPPIGGITPLGMRICGIFIGMIYAYITLKDFAWPSMLALVLIGLTDFTTINGAFASGFGQTTFIMIVFGFIFASLIKQFDMAEWIAAKVMSSKMMIGRPWLIIFMFFLGGWLVTIAGSSMAAIFLMWGIMGPLLEAAGYEKGSKTAAYIMGGTVFVNKFAAMAIPFHILPLQNIGYISRALPGWELPYGKWIMLFLTFTIVAFAGWMFVGKFILRVDLSKFNTLGDMFADKRDFKPSTLNKIGMTCILCFLAILVIPEFLPEHWPAVIFIKQFGMVGVVSIMLVVLAVLRDKEAKPLISVDRTMGGGLAWSMLLSVMAILVFTSALLNPDTGINETLAGAFSSIFGGMPGMVFVIIAIVVAFVLANVINAGIIIGVMIPILVPVADSMGLNAPMIGLLISMSACGSFFLPSCSSQSVMIHSQEWVGGYGYKLVTAMCVLTLILLLAVGMPLAYLIF